MLAGIGGSIAAFAAGFAIFFLIFIVLVIVGSMRVFKKAGKPQWAAIIPIYNTYVLLKIISKPVWWMVPLVVLPFGAALLDLPGTVIGIINLIAIVFGIMATYYLAQAFGKGIGFTIGLVLLAPIFIMILGFGKATYRGGMTGYTATPEVPTTSPTV